MDAAFWTVVGPLAIVAAFAAIVLMVVVLVVAERRGL